MSEPIHRKRLAPLPPPVKEPREATLTELVIAIIGISCVAILVLGALRLVGGG